MTTPFDTINQTTAEKQFNSRMCFVCGLQNPSGLHAHFYQKDNKTCVGRFVAIEDHQGYPGRAHGGVISAMMDETLGRTVWGDAKTWGVTAELTIRYKAPVPIGEVLTVVGRITDEKRRYFEADGELYTASGQLAVTASGRFVKLDLEKILREGGDLDPKLELFVVPDEEARWHESHSQD